MIKRTYFFIQNIDFIFKYMVEHIVKFDDIGPVCFVRNAKSRHLKIYIRPHQKVKVAVPELISLKSAYKFVQSKKNWIIKQQDKVADFEKKLTVFDAQTDFRTREHTLKLHLHEKSSIKTIINQEFIHVYFPSFANVKDSRIQQAIRHAIIETWRIEAKKLLPVMADNLARKYGFHYKRISIRNNKTRWGSCSKNNNINLNLHLIRLPQHLCEYVILHELAHTVYKNHQKPFWNLLDQFIGNAKKLDQELNKYRIEIW